MADSPYLKHNQDAVFKHRRIVPLKQRKADETRLWLVTKKPESPSLTQVAEKQSTFSLKKAIAVLSQVGEALAFLHGQGYVHSNVNPDVIFFDKERSFLGWSPGDVRSSSGSERGANNKLDAFIAPEVKQRAPYDTRCDIYSLGLLLHWMLTGSAPDGTNVSSKIPESVARIIRQAVATDPDARFQTASAFTDALENISEKEVEKYDKELHLAVTSAGIDPRLLWRRWPKTVIFTALLILVFGVGGRWLILAYAQQERQKELALQQKQEKIAKRNAEENRYQLAKNLYAKGKYRGALEKYTKTAQQDIVKELNEPSMAQIARCYGKLENYSAEHTAWQRLLRRFPDSEYAQEANNRIVWIAGQTIKRYGQLMDIRTEQEINIDGLMNDWSNIDPLQEDPRGDNLKGGGKSDLVAFYAAVNHDRLYVCFETAEPPREGDQFCLAITLNAYEYEDSSEHWDFQIGVSKGTPPWIWNLQGKANYDNTQSQKLHGARFAQKECVEISFPLSKLGNSKRVGFRPFINYQDEENPNDGVRRKVLVKWHDSDNSISQKTEAAKETSKQEKSDK